MEKKCVLCKMSMDDPVKLGEFKTIRSISAHYYCLLLTSNLCQNGTDSEGILGFLPEDIRKEEKRIKSQICFYCNKPYANIGCCARKCIRTFHLYCGLENLAICHFKDDFRTICSKHHKSSTKKKCTPADECAICCESMGRHNRVLSILAPCCKSGWFHKWCMAKYALNAGYFFKCPLCNDKETFRDRLVHKGIFVPDQDAAWELEPNAFAELLVRPDECSAEKCLCRKGRNYRQSIYKLLTCNTCGSKCIHVTCMTKPSKIFTCSDCIQSIQTQSSGSSSSSDLANNNFGKENVESKKKLNYDSDNDSVDSMVMSYAERGAVLREQRISVDEAASSTFDLHPKNYSNDQNFSGNVEYEANNKLNNADKINNAKHDEICLVSETCDPNPTEQPNIIQNEIHLFGLTRKRKQTIDSISDLSVSSKKRAKSVSDYDRDDEFTGFTDIDENSANRLLIGSYNEYFIADSPVVSKPTTPISNVSDEDDRPLIQLVLQHKSRFESLNDNPRKVAMTRLRARSTYIERNENIGEVQYTARKLRARAKSQCDDRPPPVRRSLRLQEKEAIKLSLENSDIGKKHERSNLRRTRSQTKRDTPKENRNSQNYQKTVKAHRHFSPMKLQMSQCGGGKMASTNYNSPILMEKRSYDFCFSETQRILQF